MFDAGGPEGVGQQAELVDLHALEASIQAVGQGDDPGVAMRFAENHVIGVRQATDRHQQAMLRARREDDLLPPCLWQAALYPAGTGLLVHGMTTVGGVVQNAAQIR
ncbi:hypothetical protein D3C79_934400 [compost metagenome]